MSPDELLPYAEVLLAQCETYARRDPAVWTHLLSAESIATHASTAPKHALLSGLTFAIKDNIDLADTPTTAGCPGFAYTPAQSAHVVSRLLAAGAIPLGKTNLDQFATGLVGTRSPYGAPHNVFNPEYISGGSSSGSAVAVAAGLVDFALGTDTAGSGRVPAAFNQIIGLKPTRGLLSTRGVVPACRSLDCVSIFARDIATTARALAAARGFDPDEPWSRRHPAGQNSSTRNLSVLPRIGVPLAHQLEWFGNDESPLLFATALERLRALGAQVVEIDFTPFLEAARLLYEGPWTAERYAAVGAFIEQHVSSAELDPTVEKIILGGKSLTAADAFNATYRLAELRRAADMILASVDVIVAPTTGTIYTKAEIEADPIRLNANLGRYNNFMNLLDLCGLTLPAGRYTDGPGFGITLIAPAWHDLALLDLGARYLGESVEALDPLVNDQTSPEPEMITVAVCGAHLRGQPLHGQLTALNARLIAATTTAPCYRLYALANTTPPKPGLARVAQGEPGAAIAVETYALTPEAFGRLVAAVPAPLAIGTATLADGSSVKSFLCEPVALAGAQDITSFGGWVAYLKSK